MNGKCLSKIFRKNAAESFFMNAIAGGAIFFLLGRSRSTTKITIQARLHFESLNVTRLKYLKTALRCSAGLIRNRYTPESLMDQGQQYCFCVVDLRYGAENVHWFPLSFRSNLGWQRS